jgi:hypothetical protein
MLDDSSDFRLKFGHREAKTKKIVPSGCVDLDGNYRSAWFERADVVVRCLALHRQKVHSALVVESKTL